jgi:hypothetical protein
MIGAHVSTSIPPYPQLTVRTSELRGNLCRPLQLYNCLNAANHYALSLFRNPLCRPEGGLRQPN